MSLATEIGTQAPVLRNLFEQVAKQGEWVHRAACRGMDPEMFFPDQSRRAECSAAVAVCARCEVSEECLDFALASHEKFGTWGGLGEKERRAVKRGRRSRVVA